MKGLVSAGLVLLACDCRGREPAPDPAAEDVTTRTYRMPALPHARVTLVDGYGYRRTLDVEVAATREARTRGLMWRETLAGGSGMLFIFPTESRLTFWMKNTLIPLDMIFLSGRRVIVGIVDSAVPGSLSPRGPEARAKYVLEVPGGWAAKAGLAVGGPVTLEGIEAIVPSG